jgi:Flp pilus assembly protein TadD
MTTASPGATGISRRSRWLRVAAVLVAVVGIAAGSWWWWFHPAAAEPPPVPEGIKDADVRESIAFAREQVLASPRSGPAWGRLAMIFLVEGFPHEADVCLAQADQLQPGEPKWPYARGFLLSKQNPEAAVALFRRAVSLADARPNYEPAMTMQLAEALLQIGHLDEAEKVFQREAELRPGNLRAAFGLGQCAAVRGDDALAAKLLWTARTTPFARKRAISRLAMIARARGDVSASAKFEAEARVLPEDAPWPDPFREEVSRLGVGAMARTRLIAELEGQENYSEAAAEWLKRLEEKPSPSAYVGAAANLTKLGDPERALPLLAKAVAAYPESASVHAQYATTLFARASKGWKAPGSADARESLRKVVEHARRATELRPDQADAYLHWGQALRLLGEPTAAMAPLRTGVACQPSQMEYQLALGEALLEAGEYKEAASYIDHARLLAPNDPRPLRAQEQLSQKKVK